MDGIDAVVLEVAGEALQVGASLHHEYPADLVRRLRAAIGDPDSVGLDEYGRLDVEVGERFAAAAAALLSATGLKQGDVRAIGSHGQTILHRPRAAPPCTLQIGDPNTIAERCGIDVVADFRRRDLCAGGEAAPLVPAFHAAAFGKAGESRVVANLGGIANITVLPGSGDVSGFDTGPGNCLMDLWAQLHLGTACDIDGAFAASGHVDATLLGRLMAEPYFSRQPPKSTGRELFRMAFIDDALEGLGGLRPADVQATLCELTAATLGDAIRLHTGHRPARVLVCGGGVYNAQLLRRIAADLIDIPVESTAVSGIDPMQVEGAAFAWLAHRRLEGLPGNLPAVTGAQGPRVLGGLFSAGVTRM
jgi:anhydro-N-acetylmuramic acid kinase